MVHIASVGVLVELSVLNLEWWCWLGVVWNAREIAGDGRRYHTPSTEIVGKYRKVQYKLKRIILSDLSLSY